MGSVRTLAKMVTLGFWVALLGLSVAEVVWGATVSCPEGYASSLSKAGDQCYRKQTCSDAGCSIVGFLQGPSSCKKEISKPLSIDVVKDLKMDGNAVLINAVKGSSNKWLQLVGSNWEDIEAKVNQFTLDSSACANSATVCVLVWDGTKLRAVMYSTKEIEITITTNASPLVILMGGASSSTETKKVKIEGFCQVQGTAIPSGPQCNPVDCYPNAECINGQCICKAGFSLYNNLPKRTIYIMDKIKNEILKNTLVTFNEGGKTKSLKTKDDGTLELLGCIDQNTKFKIEGYCESAKLATISGPIVEMTQFTSVVFVVANAKDDSPIKDAAIVIDPSKTVTTDENGNHVEEHCEALNNKEFGIKKDDFCDAKVTVEKLEGAKDFKWALMHPKTKVQVKVVDTEGKPISDVQMDYKNEANVAQTAQKTDTDGDLSIDDACHGQILKEVEFSKDGFCKFKQDLEVEESPSYFLQVALRKEISNEVVYEQKGVVPIVKAKRITSITDWGFGYKIEFKVTLTKAFSASSDVNLLHISQGGDDNVDGDRIPAIFLTETSKLKIISDVEGISEADATLEKSLTVGTEVTVSIEFSYNSYTDKGSLVYKIGTEELKKETTTKPKVYQNADLYLSNVWSDSAAAYVTVKDLSVISTNPTMLMVQMVDKTAKTPVTDLKLKVTVLDTKEYREVTADAATGVACIHELCEDVDVKIEVVAGQPCQPPVAGKTYSGSVTFYRVEAKITHVNFPVECK